MIKKEPFMHGSFHSPGPPSCALPGLCQDTLWALSMSLGTWRRESSLWGWFRQSAFSSATHKQQRESYARWGVGISEEKAHVWEPIEVRMGAGIDRVKGTVSAPMAKKIEVSYFTRWLLGLHLAPTKTLLMVLGRLVRCFEFRRSLMTLLGSAWPKGHVHTRRPLSQFALRNYCELWHFSPRSVSNVVTCSDASEAGGGLYSSGGLTTEGEQYQEDRYTSFMPQGAMRSSTKKGIRIAVISLFDGISALMCTFSRLQGRIVAFQRSRQRV